MNSTAIKTATALKPFNYMENLGSLFLESLDASEKTRSTYQRALRQFLFYLKAEGIEEPEREDILAYKSKLSEEGKKPSTIQNYIVVVKLFCAWLEDEGYIEKNPARKVKGAKLDRNFKKDVLTEQQQIDLLNSIDRSTLQGKRDFAIIVLMSTNGLRDIEVVRANIEDIRTVFSERVLYVQGKGREEKTEAAVLDSVVEKAIRDYLKERECKDPSAPLFASLDHKGKGERLSTRSISRIIKNALIDIGIDSERVTAHSLRHTAITNALKAGATLQQVQQFARHVSPSTTLIYSHNLEAVKNPCSKLNAALYKGVVNI